MRLPKKMKTEWLVAWKDLSCIATTLSDAAYYVAETAQNMCATIEWVEPHCGTMVEFICTWADGTRETFFIKELKKI